MSIGASLFQIVLRLIGFREIINRQFQDPPRNTHAMDNGKFQKDLPLQNWSIQGFKLISINPSTSNNKHLIFFHGGAYVIEASSFHRRFMEILAREYGLAITFVDYPKAPEHTFQTTIDVVLAAYFEIARRNPGDDLCLIGDSAGGGLALSLLQVLRDRGVTPFPHKTVLISPWLDLSMSNELIPEYEHKDQLLPVEGLIHAAEQYAGGEDLKNPLLSPLYGDMTDLGSILLFCGTNEILYPDCLDLIKRTSGAQGSSIDYFVGKNMMHDWIIFPFKESKAGIQQIAQFILDD